MYIHISHIFSPQKDRVFIVGRHVREICAISYSCNELDRKWEAGCNKRCSKSWLKKKKKKNKEILKRTFSSIWVWFKGWPLESGQGWDKRKPPSSRLLHFQPSAGRAIWCLPFSKPTRVLERASTPTFTSASSSPAQKLRLLVSFPWESNTSRSLQVLQNSVEPFWLQKGSHTHTPVSGSPVPELVCHLSRDSGHFPSQIRRKLQETKWKCLLRVVQCKVGFLPPCSPAGLQSHLKTKLCLHAFPFRAKLEGGFTSVKSPSFQLQREQNQSHRVCTYEDQETGPAWEIRHWVYPSAAGF